MRVQLTREWSGPKDPFGNYTLYHQGHVGQIEADVGMFLLAVGYAASIDPLTAEETAALAVFSDVVSALREQNIEPTLESVGQTLGQMIAIEQQQMVMAAQQQGEPVPAVDPEPPAQASKVVAKTSQPCEIELEGKAVKFKKGVVVYDETALALIAAGHAVEIQEAA